MTAFEELGMVPELSKAIDELDWTLPTDIQNDAIPAILGGGDVLMAAETGSGKTGAFCLPVLQIVWESLRDQALGKTHKIPTSSTDDQWSLNVYDRNDNLAVDPNGVLCQSRDSQKWNGARCNKGVFGKGKYYYEGTVTDDGLCRIGWSTSTASLDLGTDKNGFGYGGTGKKSNNRQFDNYGGSFTLGDVIGCLLDLDNGTIAFSKNGQHLGKAFDIPANIQTFALYPAVVLKNAEIQFNYGNSTLKYLPQGYIAINKAPSDNVENSPNRPGMETKKTTMDKNAPACIIIEPTKELAEQTHGQLEKFKKFLNNPAIRTAVVTGSVPVGEQLRAISAGVDIITCTPGRLEDFISSGKISVQNTRFFILDEADSLVSAKNHLPTIERIQASLPKITAAGERLQMIVCSATLHNFDIKKLADRMMHFPQWVDLKGQDSVPDTVHHVVCMVDAKNDRIWIRLKPEERVMTDRIHAHDQLRPGSEIPETISEGTKILKSEYVLRVIEQHKMDQCIIFCRTKLDCDNLEQFLKRKSREYTCVCLHSDRRPDERTRNLEMFKNGKARFLICTDVAARGIDVKGVPFVINVTLPDEKMNYLHRIGRVGRADRMGLAISLVSAHPEKVWYHKCPSRGVNCNNTALITQRGCAIWYDEPKLLEDIEEYLGVTIPQIGTDMVVPVDEFDGKVVYGAKRTNTGTLYEGHAVQLSGAVSQLADLERSLQLSFLRNFLKPEKKVVA